VEVVDAAEGEEGFEIKVPETVYKGRVWGRHGCAFAVWVRGKAYVRLCAVVESHRSSRCAKLDL
jgi:hypothetical protein